MFSHVELKVAVIGGLVRYLHHAAVAHELIDQRFAAYKIALGRGLLLGLTILVAADIIKTVTVEQSLESVASLGILVLIRVVLSFALDAEVDGIVPWRRSGFESGSPSEAPSGD